MSVINGENSNIEAQVCQLQVRGLSVAAQTRDSLDGPEKSSATNRAAVEKTVQAFFNPGEPIELRYRRKPRSVGAGVYADHQQFVTDACALSDDPQMEAVWFNLNEIRANIPANRHRLGAPAIKNEDIVRRRLILIDVEAKKPEQFKLDSATDEEKHEAYAEVQKVAKVLHDFGIPSVEADSGNGFHRVVRVDLPCDAENDALVHDFLQALQRLVPTAKIDLAVHNRARVTKLYGTRTRKGRALSERPWRFSSLLCDCDRTPVAADRLRQVINAVPGPTVQQSAIQASGQQTRMAAQAVSPDFDFREFLSHYNITTRQEGNIFATNVCIMAGSKHSGDPDKSGFYFDGNHLGWNCFSNDCANYTIADVIRKLNKNRPPYPKLIWPEKNQPRAGADRAELPLVEEYIVDDSSTALQCWPAETLEGDCLAEYMHLVTDGTQVPPQFVREQLKVILGALHDGRIGFPGHSSLGARHYIQLITDGPEGCKDESWRRTLGVSAKHWSNILTDSGIHVLDGSVFGSGQYIAKELESKPHCLAVFGEGREVWEKNAHQGSTLESALLKLYDGTSHWTGSLTNKRHGSDDIHLSLTSFFTLDGFRASFSSKGSGGGGYLSRNVIAYSSRRPYAGIWPDQDSLREQKAVEEILALVPTEKNFLDARQSVWIPDITPDARKLFDTFTREIEDPDHIHREYVPRVADLTKRDLLIRARYSGGSTITQEMVERAINWGWHQLSLRVALWPFDRGSQVEAMTWTILRAIKNHPPGVTEAKLRDFCHVDRPGSGGQEVFNRAFRALQLGRRIKAAGRTQKSTVVWGVSDE
jgi:hypothetical protein